MRAAFGEQPWYAVRCVFESELTRVDHDDGEVGYEERITLWRAASFDEAIELAGEEATRYVDESEGVAFTGLAQAYHLFDEPGHGSEVFSLIRLSTLKDDDYLARYFETGKELSGIVE
jgi:hypothetical protein